MRSSRIAKDQALPFELKIPNAETRAAMAEVQQMIDEKQAQPIGAEELFDELDHS